MTDIFPESREEEILVSTINGEEYDKAPESRIEALLLELKEVIEEGGGGGGTTNYNLLQNKPSINSVTLTGDKSLEDLSIPTAADLAGKQDVLPVTASGNDVAFNGDIQDGQGNTLSVLAEALTRTASGNPVVITDCAGGKARSLITSINAIQDLHGYDKPWSGGSGKNKLPMTVSAIKAANTVGTWSGNIYTWNGNTFEILTDSANNVLGIKVGGTNNGTACRFQVCNEGFIGDGSYYLNGSSTEFSGGQTQLYTKYSATNYAVSYNGADTPFTVSSGYTIGGVYILVDANISFSSPIIYRPMIRLSTESDASFAPYSNVCPISGRTAARVDDVGKNLLPYDAWKTVGIIGGSAMWENNGVTLTATANDCYTRFLEHDFPQGARIPITNGQKITISWQETTNKHGLVAIFPNASMTGLVTADNATAKKVTYTGKSGDTFITFRFGVTNSGDTIAYKNIMIEYGETSHDYEPYAHSSATIQLGTTVYGADINWDTGVMTVTHVLLVNNTADMDNSEDWPGWRTSGIRQYIGGGINRVFTEQTMNVGTVYGANTTGNDDTLILPKDTYNLSQTEWKALSTDVQIIVPLATPTTIQLTPTMLEMLKGYNRVTVESGTITLDYIAKAISGNDEEIAPLVGDKATKSYAVNDFIERADGLYRVTAPIASGASFTANNTVKMSIGEALTYLYNK